MLIIIVFNICAEVPYYEYFLGGHKIAKTTIKAS